MATNSNSDPPSGYSTRVSVFYDLPQSPRAITTSVYDQHGNFLYSIDSPGQEPDAPDTPHIVDS